MARDEAEIREAHPPPLAEVPPPVGAPGPPGPAVPPVPSSGRGTDDGGRRRSLPKALLMAARPKQWSKNVLVFAAPGAAGVLGQGTALFDSLVAFACFCLAASGTYYLNDASDVEADRLHPHKRFRPIAAGELSPRLAQVLGPILIVSGVALGLLAHWQLSATVLAYVLLTTSYTVWLKHVAVVDIVAVAAGFVLRAIGGAAATGVEISRWFLIVASFAALFMVVGKRYSESTTMGEGAAEVRSTLGMYSTAYLAYLRSVSTGVMLVAYCLWAFDKYETADARYGYQGPWFQLSIVPFAMAVLRYALLVDRGEGGAPEDVVLSDRQLQIFGALWAVVFGLGILLTPGPG